MSVDLQYVILLKEFIKILQMANQKLTSKN